VGRAARTALLLAPLETTEIRVTYTTTGGQPVATYTFSDLRKLNRYFNGMLRRSDLSESVTIRYADPAAFQHKEQVDVLAALEEPVSAGVLYGDEGNVVSFKRQGADLDVFQVKPTLNSYINGPNVFQFSLGVLATYERELYEHLFLNSGVSAILYENITDAVGVNTSTLPHVRSDFAEYAKGPAVRLDRLLLNRVYHPSERTYARLTGGYLEQMYGGVGGQWLYVERGAPWAFDLSVDAVRKRDYDGWLGFLDYHTVTALAAVHYRLPYQSTFTTRAGRFLARDYGARFEISRRFRIGLELGAWYTVTNAVDAGVGNEPNYRDKGVFMSIPFEPLLARDSSVVTGFSLAPWTRDVGQMLNTPVDLYRMVEKPLVIDVHRSDGLSRLGDMEDDTNLPYLGSPMWDRPFENLGRMTVQDWGQGAGALGSAWPYILVGTGAVLVSSAGDRAVDRFVQNRAGSSAIDRLASFGEWSPLAAVGVAGLAALSESDSRLSNTGIAALQAGATGYLASATLKYAVGRARPAAESGPTDFEPFGRSDASFPSNHATIMWAAVTPFAREYDAPWLYGLAALTNAGRIASREHWLSDTVASTVIGWAIGDFFWEQRKKGGDKAPKVAIGPSGVTLMWETK
jgi:membrane-associated phospholipid phosphatase